MVFRMKLSNIPTIYIYIYIYTDISPIFSWKIFIKQRLFLETIWGFRAILINIDISMKLRQNHIDDWFDYIYIVSAPPTSSDTIWEIYGLKTNPISSNFFHFAVSGFVWEIVVEERSDGKNLSWMDNWRVLAFWP